MTLLRMSSGLGVLFSCLLFVSMAETQKDQSLQSQVVRIQSQSGQLITQFEGQSIDVLLFGEPNLVSLALPKSLSVAMGAISQDGEQIAFQQIVPATRKEGQQTGATKFEGILSVALTNGDDLRQFPEIKEPTEFCWSPDTHYLAIVRALETGPGRVTGHELQVVNLNSAKVVSIDSSANISSQCWNKRGTALVFENGGSIKVFDIETGRTSPLGTGENATWSPDGRLIAFRRRGSYYTIDPSGTGERLLFTRKDALTPLWWSSGSDLVSFVAQPSVWKSSWNILDELDLCVIRLTDRKEMVAYRFSGKGRPVVFQWVKNSALLARAKAAHHR